MTVYTLAITFATSGISLACTCIVSEEIEKNNKSSGIKAANTCIKYSIFLGTITMLIFLSIAPFITTTLLKNKVTTTPIYAISLGLPCISISAVISGYFSSVGKSYKNAISKILELLIKIISTIILLKYTINQGINAICSSLIIGDVISEFFACALNLILYKYDIKKKKQKRSYTTNIGKRIIKISLPVAITSYIRSALSSLKQFLIPLQLQISGLSYTLAVSKYGLITGMVMPVLMFCSFFINSYSSLLIPEYVRLQTGKNYNRIKTISHKIFYITYTFSILISGIFLIYPNEISLAVYKNIEAAQYIKILSPLIIFMYIDHIIDSMLKGINSQFGVMCINILDLIITITIIYFLVPKLGLNGYILSIFISEIFNYTASFTLLKHKTKFKFDTKQFCIKPLITLVLTYIITRPIQIPIQNSIIYTILNISVFTLTYITITSFTTKKQAII